jgi:hypothetical protein
MRKLILLLVIATVAVPAFAQTVTLRPDAVVCENEAPLQLLDWPNLRNQPGSVVVQRLKATAQLEELMSHANGILRNGALQEQAIRNAANINGNTTPQANDAASQQQVAMSKEAQAKSFLRHCMATDSNPTQVTIVKRLPISGVAQISMIIKGAEAKVWTAIYYLQ